MVGTRCFRKSPVEDPLENLLIVSPDHIYMQMSHNTFIMSHYLAIYINFSFLQENNIMPQ
jgi:hypothetical protein